MSTLNYYINYIKQNPVKLCLISRTAANNAKLRFSNVISEN